MKENLGRPVSVGVLQQRIHVEKIVRHVMTQPAQRSSGEVEQEVVVVGPMLHRPVCLEDLLVGVVQHKKGFQH